MGILNTWPILSKSLVSPFNCLIASTVVPYFLEICHKLHQDILCNLPLPVFGVHVILIANLEDNLME